MNPHYEPTALKLLSFLLAMILWITTLCFRREEQRQEVTLVPILPLGVTIENRIPPKLQVTLSGSRLMLEEAKRRIQPIRLDLTKNRETTIGFSVTEDLLGELPKGVRVVAIFPSQVLVQLQKLDEK